MTTHIDDAYLLSISEIIIEFPDPLPLQTDGDIKQDAGNPVAGFSVSISNDGNTFSKNESTFIVYDGRCMQCDTKKQPMCKQKVNCKMHISIASWWWWVKFNWSTLGRIGRTMGLIL